MEKQTYTKVVIDGKVYNLAGQEEEQYLQRLAGYVNHTIAVLKEQGGLQKQTTEIRNLMIFLQMADDYLKEKDAGAQKQQQLDELETQTYDIKHNLVTCRMQLEQLESMKKESEQMKERLSYAEEKTADLQGQVADLRAQIKLLTETNQALEGKTRALAERYTQLKNRNRTV